MPPKVSSLPPSPTPARAAVAWRVWLALSPVLVGCVGCATRSSVPIVRPDSTSVYPSKLPGDIEVSLSFALKDSKIREEQLRRERERVALERERSRLQRDVERRERVRARREAQRAQRQAAPKRSKGPRATRPKPTPTQTKPDTLGAAAARRIAQIDSLLATFPTERFVVPADERVFALEEGARVQATIRIDNPYGRGKRPVMFHVVWLNPEGKRVFKRMIQWVPNDTSRVLTTSLTLSPAKRTAGFYTLQVYLFRELIAQARVQLLGESHARPEAEDRTGM